MALSRLICRRALPLFQNKGYIVPASRLFCDKAEVKLANTAASEVDTPKPPPYHGVDPATGKKYRDGIELGGVTDPDWVYFPPPDIKVEYEGTTDIEEMKKLPPLPDFFDVWFGRDMPTIHDEKHPERDVVNFPRPKLAVEVSPVRFEIIPAEWFHFFYKKTGVTGPYLFFGGLLGFLASKEWLIYEHEMLTGTSIVFIFLAIRHFYGDKFAKIFHSVEVTEEQAWEDWQKNMKITLKDFMANQKKFIAFEADKKMIYEAKKENIHLQREAEYRRRQMGVHEEVKRKCDYQVAKQEAQGQFAQKHMVGWIIDKVNKSITTDLQKKSLDDAIGQLKLLSSKRAGVI